MSRKDDEHDESGAQPNSLRDELPDEAVSTSDLSDEETTDNDESSEAAGDGDQSDASNESDSANDDQKSEAMKRKAKGARRRIRNLQKRLSESKAESETTKSENTRLRQELAELRKEQADAPEPQITDFDKPQDYARAHAKWERNKKKATSKSDDGGKKRRQTKADDVPAQPPEAYSRWEKDGTERLGEAFTDALKSEEVAVSPMMGELILDSDYGPEIYVHLADNPEISVKLFKMSSLKVAKEIQKLEEQAADGKLELDLEDYDVPKKKPTSRKRTKAKEPPSSDRSGKGSTQRPNPETESTDDYMRRRMKEYKERRRRY